MFRVFAKWDEKAKRGSKERKKLKKVAQALRRAKLQRYF